VRQNLEVGKHLLKREDVAIIIDNKIGMHMIVRTKHNLDIPSREDTEHRYYFLRDILDKLS